MAQCACYAAQSASVHPSHGVRPIWRCNTVGHGPQRVQVPSSRRQLAAARLDQAAPESIDTDDDAVASTRTRTASPAETTLLFDGSHIPQLTPALALYLPLGVLLATFRSALWLAGIALDAPWFRQESVVAAYLKLLGVSITWKHAERLPQGKHVMVSNHTSVGDLMFLYQTPITPRRRYTHLVTTALPPRVTRTANLPVTLRPASPAVFDQLAAAADDPSPLHVFPEGGMTSGRGMMRFSRGFMRMVLRAGLPIVPVALRVSSPMLGGVNNHTLLSSFMANLWWFSFCPTMVLEATVLPAMYPTEGEGKGAFVRRVQQAISDELQVPIVDMTVQQKRQLMQAAKGLQRV